MHFWRNSGAYNMMHEIHIHTPITGLVQNDGKKHFLLIGKTKAECSAQTQELMALLRSLGFAINYHKVVGPTQKLTFLGVELDSVECTLGLPVDKMNDFITEVNCLNVKKSVSKR